MLVGFNDLATVVPKVADLNEQAEALFSRQRKMRRSQRKLLHLLIVKHGGSAKIAIMNGIHLFLHAQAEASALVAVAIPL